VSTPLCLVTGFLGSGKTSLLAHLARQYRERRIVYLVNEFCEVDIDATRLAQIAPDVVAIPGGSIFCRCLVGEFMTQLRRLPTAFGQLDGVLVEASGMADPGAVDTLLSETGLAAQYEVRSVVAVVDPGTFHKLCRTLPNIMRQVAAAGLVVINKADLHDTQTLQATEERVRALNPTAEMVLCSFGALDRDVFAAPAPRIPSFGPYAACRDPNYASWTLDLDGEVDLDALRHGLEDLGPALYRAKGHARCKGRLYAVDLAAGRLTCIPAKENLPARLVLISRGQLPPEHQTALRHRLRARG
jgi:G3E family GTPase